MKLFIKIMNHKIMIYRINRYNKVDNSIHMKLCKASVIHRINNIFCQKKNLKKEYFAIRILFEYPMLLGQKQINISQKIFSILNRIKEKVH